MNNEPQFNLEGVPHYELGGRILFHKARHREMAMAPRPTWKFSPYVSPPSTVKEAKDTRYHWNGCHCHWANILKKRVRHRLVLDGEMFDAKPEANRCSFCDKWFQKS